MLCCTLLFSKVWTQEAGMYFIENKGQWREDIQFSSPLHFGNIYFENNSFLFVLSDFSALNHNHEDFDHHHDAESIDNHLFKIEFLNTSSKTTFNQEHVSNDYINYFLGNDQKNWATHAYKYQNIVYQNLYDGIDLKVEGEGDDMKYEFYVSPNSNPNTISYVYKGIDDLKLKNGDLVYSTSVASITETKPYVYQLINERLIEVPCNYLLDGNHISFEFPNGYNANYELVIDPTLIFASYSGSTLNNFGFTATYDNSGNLYGGGIIYGQQNGLLGYPTVNAIQDSTLGSLETSFDNGFFSDMSITKFNNDGTNLLYSTILGGSRNEQPQSMVVNSQNELVIYGRTNSPNFPVSLNAFDTSHNGGLDIIITKLSANGDVVVGSTFFGGSNDDGVNVSAHPSVYNATKHNYADDGRGEVIVNELDEIFIGSSTQSDALFSSAFQNNLSGTQDGLILKFNDDLSNLIWGSYYGGNDIDAVYSLKIDNFNNLLFTGGTSSIDLPNTNGVNSTYLGGSTDGFVAKFAANGSTVINSTYLGTTQYDQSFFVELDFNQDVFLYGQTNGSYPFTLGKYGQPNSSQFIHKLSNDLNTSLWSTTFGTGDTSSVNISPTAFLVDNCRNIYISGWGGNSNTGSPFVTAGTIGLPISSDAQQSTTDNSDFYFMVLDENADDFLYGSFYGGNQNIFGGSGEHVDGGTSRFDEEGIIYQAVCASCNTADSNFPTSAGSWSTSNPAGNGCNLGVIKMQIYVPTSIIAVDASPTATGCVPLVVDFEATVENVNVFNWDFGDGSFSTEQNPTHVYTDTGTFNITLVGIDSTNCNGTDTALLQVIVGDDSLQANFTDSINIDCENLTVTVAAQENYPNTQFLWRMGDGAVYNTREVTHVYGDTGSYTISLILNDSTSCELLDSAELIFYMPPEFQAELTASDSIGCAPLQIAFTSNYPNFDIIEWDFGDGTPISNLQNPSHTFYGMDTFQVRLIITDSSTCNGFDTLFQNVYVFNDTFQAEITNDPFFFQCDSMQLNAWANNSATSHYWGFGNGTMVSDSAAQSFYVSGIYNGFYYATDTNFYCSQEDSAFFEVNLQEELEVDALASDTFGCVPFTVNFLGSSNILPESYFWNFGNGDTSTSQNPTYTFQNIGNYTISLIAENPLTCNISDTIFLEITVVNDSVEANINKTETLYECDSLVVNLSAAWNGGTHQWDLGNGDTIFGQNVSYTYFSLGDYTISYTIVDSSQYCLPIDTASTTIHFESVTANLTANDTAGCIPLQVNFNNLSSANATNFWWSDGLGFSDTVETLPVVNYNFVDTFLFTIVALDSLSCNITDTAQQQIITRDDFVTAAFDYTILNNCDTLLTIELDNQSIDATGYLWDFSTSIDTSAEPGTFSFNQVGQHIITLVATNPSLCHPNDTVQETFTLLPNVTADFTVNPNCETLQIGLTNFSNGNTQVWNFGNGENSIDFEPNFAYPESDNYTITLVSIDSTTCNITDTTSQDVSIVEFPEASFITDSNYYLYPDEVDFFNQSNFYDQFTWVFGDGNTETAIENPTHLFDGIYNFTPCLEVWNAFCADTFCKDIFIDFLPLIGVPNAFSPNGDGINDVIYVEGIGIEQLNFKIYNRWGKVVFESTDQTNGWDGIFNGTPQEMEVYTYVVDATFISGENTKLKGNITLLR